MSDDLFNKFWAAGMRKMRPRDAKGCLDKAIKQRDKERWPTPEEFVDFLVMDIQRRVDSQQNGFKKLHPTTYLNQWRWEDEYVNDDDKPSLMDRLTNRDWAKPLLDPEPDEKLIN